MDISLFFKGKVKREEIASAFIATLLKNRSYFRSFFFDLLQIPEANDLKKLDWKVEVEKNCVDINLSSTGWIMLIENKLRRGSKKKDQLAGYYMEQIKPDPKEKIVVIYLSPRKGFGEEEVDAVKQLPGFKRRNDYVLSINWEDISEQVIAESPDKDIIKSGFEEVTDVIKLDNEEKYPLEGDRIDIDEIMRGVKDKLQASYSPLLFYPWRGEDFHEIYTGGSPLNVSIEAKFHVEKEKPYKPIGVKKGSEISLVLLTGFKLTEKAKRDPKIKERWKEFVGSTSSIVVPGIGPYQFDGKFWVNSQQVTGSKNEVTERFVRAGVFLLDFLKDYLQP